MYLVKSVGERQIPHNITYMWNLKYNPNELIYEAETDSQTQRTDLRLPRRKGMGEERTERLGLADGNYYIEDESTRSYCTAQGPVFHVLG